MTLFKKTKNSNNKKWIQEQITDAEYQKLKTVRHQLYIMDSAAMTEEDHCKYIFELTDIEKKSLSMRKPWMKQILTKKQKCPSLKKIQKKNTSEKQQQTS